MGHYHFPNIKSTLTKYLLWDNIKYSLVSNIVDYEEPLSRINRNFCPHEAVFILRQAFSPFTFRDWTLHWGHQTTFGHRFKTVLTHPQKWKLPISSYWISARSAPATIECNSSSYLFIIIDCPITTKLASVDLSQASWGVFLFGIGSDVSRWRGVSQKFWEIISLRHWVVFLQYEAQLRSLLPRSVKKTKEIVEKLSPPRMASAAWEEVDRFRNAFGSTRYNIPAG